MRLDRFSHSLLGLLLVASLPATAMAQDARSRLTGLQLSGDKPIQIESDRLEVREGENVAVFSGNVSVVQGQTLLKSGRMTVYYLKDGGSAATGSANIDRLEVDGNVYLKSENQVATGDRGTFDMKSEVLVLSGKEVVLSEGENVIVGCKLTVQMKNGQAKLDGCKGGNSDGRVKMLLTPGSQNRR
ncbi:LptA/OstA family protein [Nitratireductor sp. ZSWI3]|uniref:LptA/OstA family protein n=1 Tax=Nitratireductor sp. ZSWI3 TaxID=2966359 RepID=UPI00214F6521|nr:LptA/OstA family protein [Nitratireductor sp. ZSWI3]MCR4267352.1 LptA/OstA family protein [Nitratireductor sp. ZSWI3]